MLNIDRVRKLNFYNICNIVLSDKVTFEEAEDASRCIVCCEPRTLHQDMFWMAKMLDSERKKHFTPYWRYYRMMILENEIANVLEINGFSKESLNELKLYYNNFVIKL